MNNIDPFSISENLAADRYQTEDYRAYIREQYRNRFPEPDENPSTHPWKFDPILPPTGWYYDPFYEMWVKK